MNSKPGDHGVESAPAVRRGGGFDAERGKRDLSYNNVLIEFKGPGKFNGKATSPAFREAWCTNACCPTLSGRPQKSTSMKATTLASRSSRARLFPVRVARFLSRRR